MRTTEKLNRILHLAGVAVTLGPCAAAEIGPSHTFISRARSGALELTVGIYNYASVPSHSMTLAWEQASEIFGRAGITLRWVDCPVSTPVPDDQMEKWRACQKAADFGGVFLRIVPESMVIGLRLHDTTLGVALPPAVAVVLYQRTRDLAIRLGLSDHMVLGPVMAHEVGHLLLGEQPHAAAGIMGQELRANDFRPTRNRNALFFNARQVRLMKERLRARIIARK